MNQLAVNTVDSPTITQSDDRISIENGIVVLKLIAKQMGLHRYYSLTSSQATGRLCVVIQWRCRWQTAFSIEIFGWYNVMIDLI